MRSIETRQRPLHPPAAWDYHQHSLWYSIHTVNIYIETIINTVYGTAYTQWIFILRLSSTQFFFIQHTDREYLYPTQFIIHTVKIFLCFTFRYKNSIFTFIMISLALTRISVKPFALILWPHLTQHKIDRINGNLNNPSCWLEVQVTQQPNQHSLLFSIQTVNI